MRSDTRGVRTTEPDDAAHGGEGDDRRDGTDGERCDQRTDQLDRCRGREAPTTLQPDGEEQER